MANTTSTAPAEVLDGLDAHIDAIVADAPALTAGQLSLIVATVTRPAVVSND